MFHRSVKRFELIVVKSLVVGELNSVAVLRCGFACQDKGRTLRTGGLEETELMDFRLEQNHPNPFNTTTTIEFYLPLPGYTSLKIYDALGQDVSTLVRENMPAGSYKYQWDARRLASGIYFYQLKTESFVETKKLILMK